jgi:hypothetical protein
MDTSMYVIGNDGDLIRDAKGDLVRVAPSEFKMPALTDEQRQYLKDTDDRALVFGSLPVPGPTMPAPIRRFFGFDRHDLIQPDTDVQRGQAMRQAPDSQG